jgi:hypothetical protein
VRESFVPVIRQIQALQAEGKEVALFQPNERIDGASMFYLQAYLPILQTEPNCAATWPPSPATLRCWTIPTN